MKDDTSCLVLLVLYEVGLIASNLVEFFTPFRSKFLNYLQGFQ
jgi:hypothetical protein